jgi:hypothetical protein
MCQEVPRWDQFVTNLTRQATSPCLIGHGAIWAILRFRLRFPTFWALSAAIFLSPLGFNCGDFRFVRFLRFLGFLFSGNGGASWSLSFLRRLWPPGRQFIFWVGDGNHGTIQWSATLPSNQNSDACATMSNVLTSSQHCVMPGNTSTSTTRMDGHCLLLRHKVVQRILAPNWRPSERGMNDAIYLDCRSIHPSTHPPN